MPLPPLRDPILAVLDTNVVLDLWLFDDVRAAPLREALETRRLCALVTAATRCELAHVLQRPFAQARAVPGVQVLAALERCSRTVEPAPGQSPRPPRCTDADDQKFIDLAWAGPVPWLVSRDRAVLKLARAARSRGLQIVTPEAWAAAQPPA